MATTVLPQIDQPYPPAADDAPDGTLTLYAADGARRVLVGSIFDLFL